MAVSTSPKPPLDPEAKIKRVCHLLSLNSAADLLHHYPRRHEDRTNWRNPEEAKLGDAITIRGKVKQAKIVYFGRRRLEAIIQLHGGFQGIRVIWYGLFSVPKAFAEGADIIIYGKVSEFGKKRAIYLAEYEAVEDVETAIHLNRLTPIYPTVDGLSVRYIRETIFGILQNPALEVPDIFPAAPGRMPLLTALKAIHFPSSREELDSARTRLISDEMLRMQVVLRLRKISLEHHSKVRPQTRGSLVAAFRARLPFKLTDAQEAACRDIDADLAKPQPMNRLLQGDVGSGKTVVAVHALLRCLEHGENGAFLAPTETLAEQHYLKLKEWLEPLQIRVLLYSRSSRPDEPGDDFFAAGGTLFIGTHALIQEKVKLPNLGLGVIDEQHKFGVMQRSALRMKGDRPDLLVMSATPIPRTLCLSLYGDLDVTILNEMPKGRGTLRTVIREEEHLARIWEFIRKEITAGRQVYIIYPVIDESNKKELKSLDQASKELKIRFGNDKVEMLHGKMSSEQKESVMKRFRSGTLPILASTTVIEVGVDVPNATVMLIENAERFGLAQLHQIRGRVGRGEHASYCILLHRTKTEDSLRRLQVMERTLNGFEIAEEDLAMRGPGDVLGTDQSGLPPLKLGRLPEDFDLLLKARQEAAKLLEDDPTLATCPLLRQELTGLKLIDMPASS